MTGAKTIEITRLFDAPPDLVFRCWLEPAHLLQWCSAGGGWTTPHAQTDPRLGGRFRIGFGSPDGKQDFDFTGTYTEMTPPAPGQDGRLALAVDDGRPVTVDFQARGDKTFVRLTLTLEATHSEDQQRHGWSAMLENLATHLGAKS